MCELYLSWIALNPGFLWKCLVSIEEYRLSCLHSFCLTLTHRNPKRWEVCRAILRDLGAAKDIRGDSTQSSHFTDERNEIQRLNGSPKVTPLPWQDLGALVFLMLCALTHIALYAAYHTLLGLPLQSLRYNFLWDSVGQNIEAVNIWPCTPATWLKERWR